MSTKPSPGINLDEIDWVIAPYISRQGQSYFLCYQVRVGGIPLLAHALMHYVEDNEAFYFFSIPVSHPETGKLIRRDLASDQLQEYAEKGAIYWLNQNGIKIPLEIIHE